METRAVKVQKSQSDVAPPHNLRLQTPMINAYSSWTGAAKDSLPVGEGVMIHAVSGVNQHLYARQLDLMFRMRHVFHVEGHGWAGLNSKAGRETDEFDDENAVYLMSIDPFGDVAASVRLNPTTGVGFLVGSMGFTGCDGLEFDAATGAAKWSWKGDGPAYASPIVVELYGVRQVVTQSQKNIVSVAAATGDLLWKMPFTTPYEQNSVTPALHEEMLIFSGLDDGIMGVKAAKDANQWTTEKRWHNRTVSMYMNSPVVAGDLMFGFSHRNKGQLFCLDPRTGSTLWSAGGREGENAAMVSAGSAVLALISDGRLIVFKKSSKAFEPVRRYTVAESPTWAHPLLLDRAIVIKDASTLARWNLE
jgi:outer membrane protein assembly factor BamB